MPEYIEREKVLAAIQSRKSPTRSPAQNEMLRTIRVDVNHIPAADVAPVVPELRKTVELLHNEYEKAKQLDFVSDPLAYAVYQVWKAVDRRRKNGR